MYTVTNDRLFVFAKNPTRTGAIEYGLAKKAKVRSVIFVKGEKENGYFFRAAIHGTIRKDEEVMVARSPLSRPNRIDLNTFSSFEKGLAEILKSSKKNETAVFRQGGEKKLVIYYSSL